MNGMSSRLYSGGYSMAVNGDIVRSIESQSLVKGPYVKVPLIAGSNTDEGTGQGPSGINTTEQLFTWLITKEAAASYSQMENLPPEAANEILSLYPDNSTGNMAAYLGDSPTSAQGPMWRRTSTYAGDYQQHAGRRATCQSWATHGAPAYCEFYLRDIERETMDQRAWINEAAHFEEVVFIFNDLEAFVARQPCWMSTSSVPFSSSSVQKRASKLHFVLACIWLSPFSTAMAEALGAVASGIAVAQVAGTAGSAIWKLKQLWDEVEDVPEIINDLIEQLGCLDPSLWDA
ncbi:carboxylesterase [Seiridium cupressi]